MNNLEDSNAAGLIVPYLGKYAPLELVQIFEQYYGNTLNVTLSKPGNGVYVYDVAPNTKGYTKIKYWFDTATKSMLEEAAVFFDPEKRPTTAEVEKYMTYLGMTFFVQNRDIRQGTAVLLSKHHGPLSQKSISGLCTSQMLGSGVLVLGRDGALFQTYGSAIPVGPD